MRLVSLDVPNRTCIIECSDSAEFERVDAAAHNALHMIAKAVSVDRAGNTATIRWEPPTTERTRCTPAEVFGLITATAAAGENAAQLDARVLAMFRAKRTDRGAK